MNRTDYVILFAAIVHVLLLTKSAEKPPCQKTFTVVLRHVARVAVFAIGVRYFRATLPKATHTPSV